MSMQKKYIYQKTNRQKTCLLASTLAFAVAMPSITLAQDSYLEEILVTARKVEENLQSTPVAVSAFTEESLERRMITSTEDLSRITPNLQFKSYSPLSGNSSAAQVFIRGVGQSDSSGGVDPGVGMYIDDVYMGRSVGGVLDFRDIANVQVLRGPQGALFGRNTIGGAVLLSSTAPGSEFGGKVKVGVGSDSLREFFGAVDLPFSDTVAARVSLGSRNRDGYVKRIFDGVDLGNEDSYTVNGSLHLDPLEGLNLVIRGDYTEEEENGSPFVFAAINENAAFPAVASVRAGCPGATAPNQSMPGPPSVPVGLVDTRCANNATWDLGEYKNGGNSRAESNLENSGFSFHANWEINDLMSLKYVYADRSLEWNGSRDADNTPFTILSTQYESEADQTSHELQVLFQSDSFHGVIGAFSFDEDVHDFLLVPFGPPAPTVVYPVGTALVDYQDAKLNNQSTAFFTQWSVYFNDMFSITAGARYTDEDKSMRIISTNVGASPTPVTGTLSFPVPAGPYLVPFGPHKQSFDATTFSLSGQLQFTDTLMAYLSWSEGFKSGGFNQRYNATPTINGGNVIPFDSEQATTIELGFKADLTDSFRLNGAIFDTTYEDMQLTYRNGIVPLLFNAGESSIFGAELEFTYAPSAELIVEGSLGYLDDEIESISAIPGVSATLTPDNSLPFTPEITASLGVAYIFDIGDLALTPRLDISYTDEQFFDAANSVEVAQSSAETVLNFSLKFGDSGDYWNVVAGIDNLRNETYVVAGNSSLSTGSGYAEVIYSRPRTAYVSATINF